MLYDFIHSVAVRLSHRGDAEEGVGVCMHLC